MKAKMRIMGVPLHPLLVHFPIAFWLFAPLLDLAVCALLIQGVYLWTKQVYQRLESR